ncbi:MAG: phosphoenolpyruvate--protein phosphotransferase [Tissierellia bacterium]|nr:phosphoenolpyruvate--protein phosphotransferase [Tissierellia bacterium]
MNRVRKGICASDGLAYGPIFKFERRELRIPKGIVKGEKAESEIVVFRESLQGTMEFLQKKIEEGSKQSDIFVAHIGMLEDPFFVETVEQKILGEGKNAAWSMEETGEELALMMEAIDDPYLRERASDYRDLKMQLLHRILNIPISDFSEMKSPAIIAARDLTPSDTALMDPQMVLGIITDLGGKTSHTSIIAQTLDIPAMVGMKDIFDELKEGQLVLVDTDQEEVILDPDPAQVQLFTQRMENWKKEKKRVEQRRFEEAITLDGKRIDVFCNIGNLEDLEVGLQLGADGVGLFRTEFLYMRGSQFPTEEEQFEVYKKAAEMLEGKALTIRTLDIGGDKELPYFQFPEEENPFLGWRALRICFDMPEVFQTQLRAILRASAFGKVLILLPMVISVQEIIRTREILEEMKDRLKEEDIPFDTSIELGIMIETPASVLMADELIRYVDYFSIGTNDLTQYLLAVDRGNQNIAHLYDSYHPAVLRSIKRVIDASHRQGKWTGMCGGFAADPKATRLLLGLGLDEFSVASANCARTKDIIRSADQKKWQPLAEEILTGESSKMIKEQLALHQD